MRIPNGIMGRLDCGRCEGEEKTTKWLAVKMKEYLDKNIDLMKYQWDIKAISIPTKFRKSLSNNLERTGYPEDINITTCSGSFNPALL